MPLLRTQNHPCVIQVHPPLVLEGPWGFLGKNDLSNFCGQLQAPIHRWSLLPPGGLAFPEVRANGGLLGGSSQDGRKWLIPRVGKSPIWGCSFCEWPKWLINGGDPNHLPENWDDPPSKGRGSLDVFFLFLFFFQVLNKLKGPTSLWQVANIQVCNGYQGILEPDRLPFLNHKLTNISRL